MQENTLFYVDIVTFILGLYIAYAAIKMNKDKFIPKLLLTDETRKKLKDSKGFITFIYKKMLFFGAGMAVISGITVLSDLYWNIPYCGAVESIVFLILFAYFMYFYRKALDKFSY